MEFFAGSATNKQQKTNALVKNDLANNLSTFDIYISSWSAKKSIFSMKSSYKKYLKILHA